MTLLTPQHIRDIEKLANAAAEAATPAPAGLGSIRYYGEWDDAEQSGHDAHLLALRQHCAKLGVSLDEYFNTRDRVTASTAASSSPADHDVDRATGTTATPF